MTRDDDSQPEQALTRRQAIAASGGVALSAGLLLAGRGEDGGAGRSAPRPGDSADAATCVLTPEQTEGPYYTDDVTVRSDITEGRKGLPLELRLAVEEAESCAPLSAAAVEVWHRDALGVYSGFTAAGAGAGAGALPPGGPPPAGGSGPPPGPPPAGGQNPGYGTRSAERAPNDATTFLRGCQRARTAAVASGFAPSTPAGTRAERRTST